MGEGAGITKSKEWSTPIVVVSKCLGFANCRWNGATIPNELVKELQGHVEFKPVCPEVEIGLGVPRNPVRVVVIDGERRLFQPAYGKDLTETMTSFSDGFLGSLKAVDGFILKGSSPSCGIKNTKLYSAYDKPGILGKGAGLFGGAVIKRFPYLAVEDDERLSNIAIREHFLTKLFTLARFRSIRGSSISSLIAFHSAYKFLLMAYSQAELRMMGKILASQKERPVEATMAQYEEHLKKALSRPPRRGNIVNVINHMMGYFSRDLKSEEKRLLLSSLEAYRQGRVPIIGATNIIKSWVVRFGNQYLSGQTFLAPYPTELLQVPTYDADRDFWRFE